MVHVIIQFLMSQQIYYVHLCCGSEPEYTNGRKDFILGPRLEEGVGKGNKF